MKRSAAFLISLVLLFVSALPALSTGAPAPADPASWKGPTGNYTVAAWPASEKDVDAVVASSVQDALAPLFSQADEASPVLCVYFDGVRVKKGAQTGAFTAVSIGGTEGFMRTADLKAIGAGAPASAMPRLAVDAGRLSNVPMKAAADDKAQTVTSFPSKVGVLVLGYNADWAHVLLNGKYGFLKASYLWNNASGAHSANPTTAPAAPRATAVPAVPAGRSTLPSTGYDFGTWTVRDNRYNAAVDNPVPSDHLNLRADPADTAESLGKYYNGARVIINYLLEDGMWAFVSVGSLNGYMSMRYLEEDPAFYPASVMPLLYLANPSSDNTALRESRSNASAVLGYFGNGTTVTVIGYHEEWAQVIIGGELGFVPVSCLQTTTEEYIPADVTWSGPTNYTYVAEWPFAQGDWTVDNPDPRDRLNLRTRPESTAPSLGKYYNGVGVTELDYVGDGWIKAQIGNLTGYMDTQFLSYDYVPSFMPSLGATEAFNLYSSMSVTSRSQGSYKKGTRVIVMGFTAQWAHAIVAGKMGFVEARCLINAPSLPDEPETPFSWGGPVGPHDVAGWPFVMYDWTVDNPNPKDRLNLRTKPQTGASSLGKYYNGVQVIELDNLGNGWIKAQIGNLTGYMDTQFLSPGYVESAMPILVTTASVHLRASGSTQAKSLGLYPKGTQVILMGFTSQWAHVIVDGQMGFMYAKYLK